MGSIFGTIFGGGGAGFQLFKQSNGIAGIYADAAARDAYFTANPTELARLDNNEFLIIKLLDNGAGQVVYQQRSSGMWVDVTSLVTGPEGSATNFAGVTKIGAIPALSSDGINYEYSGATVDQTTGQVTFDKKVEVPAGTLKVGETTNISSATGTIIIEDGINNIKCYPALSEWNSTGSEEPTFLRLATQANTELQSDFSTTITANPLIWQITTVVPVGYVRQINTFTIKTAAVMDNARAKITDNTTGTVLRYVPDKASWDAGIGVSLPIGDNVFDFISVGTSTPGNYKLGVAPFIVNPSQVIDLEIRADSVSVLGNVSNVPYQKIEYQDGIYRTLVRNTSESGIVNNHIVAFDGTTGNFIQRTPVNVISGTGGELRFLSNALVNEGYLKYDGADILLFASNSLEISANTNAVLQALGTNSIISNSGLILTQNGTPGGTTRFLVGDIEPEGAVTGNIGTIYIRVGLSDADIYIKRSGTGNTGWFDLLHFDSGVTGPVSSTNNAIALWSGTVGGQIKDSPGTLITYTATDTALTLKSLVASTGKIRVYFNDSTDTTRAEFIYAELSDFEITSDTATGIKVISGKNLELRATTLNEIYGTSIYNYATNANFLLSERGDTSHGLEIIQNGTNGGTIQVTVGNRNPNGLVSGEGGQLYLRDSTTEGSLYVKKSDTGNSDWIDVGAGCTTALNNWTASIYRPASVAMRTQAGVANTWTTMFGFLLTGETTTGKFQPVNNTLEVLQIDDTTNGDLYHLSFSGSIACNTNTIFDVRIYVTDGTNPVGGEENTIVVNGMLSQGSNFPQAISLAGLLRGPKSIVGSEAGFQVQYRLRSNQDCYQRGLFFSGRRVK